MKRAHKGQAMVEMALLLPVLVLMTVGMLDIGRAFYFQTAIANAAREGARYGATHNVSTGDIVVATQAEASGITPLTVTANRDRDATSGKFVRVDIVYEFDFVTPYIAALIGRSSLDLRSTSRMPDATAFANG